MNNETHISIFFIFDTVHVCGIVQLQYNSCLIMKIKGFDIIWNNRKNVNLFDLKCRKKISRVSLNCRTKWTWIFLFPYFHMPSKWISSFRTFALQYQPISFTLSLLSHFCLQNGLSLCSYFHIFVFKKYIHLPTFTFLPSKWTYKIF